MSEHLRNKRAVVTGASKGIGFAVAKALLAEGAHVAICARDAKSLDRAQGELSKVGGGGKIIGQSTDVSRAGEVARFFEFAGTELGGLDILINNAGLAVFKPARQLSVEEWDRQIGVNLSGAFYCSHEALRRFDPARGGWIVNISSLAGKNPFSGGAGYNASKFGLNGFSEAMMLDHRNENVRVSYIMPGSVDTHFSGREPAAAADWKIAPEDIAQIVLNVLQMPARTLISRIEVRPSRPKKD